ncbi:hypothetical protein EV175_007237, partial [Coemansia sp. RSA 1933]
MRIAALTLTPAPAPALAPALALALALALAVRGWPVADKELWMSTPETVAPKHVRFAQPPSGAHVPAPKDHPYTNEQDGHGDFSRYAARANTAPGYQYTAPSLTGVNSVLDPNAKSALDSGAAIAYKSAVHPYKPDTALFDASKMATPLPTNKWWQNLIV